jgi:hypothetical protein
MIAARCMVGQTLKAQGIAGEIVPPYFSVKEAVFPFIKFPGVDTILGPEMKSTGEVMGVGETFAEAFLKSQLAAGIRLPESGKVFISLRNADKARAIDTARTLHELGYQIVATRGTAAAFAAAGVPVTPVNKVAEGRPHIVDMIKNDEIALVFNTVEEKRSAIQDLMRSAARHDRDQTFRRWPARARHGHGEHARARPVFDPGAARIAWANAGVVEGRPDWHSLNACDACVKSVCRPHRYPASLHRSAPRCSISDACARIIDGFRRDVRLPPKGSRCRRCEVPAPRACWSSPPSRGVRCSPSRRPPWECSTRSG